MGHCRSSLLGSLPCCSGLQPSQQLAEFTWARSSIRLLAAGLVSGDPCRASSSWLHVVSQPAVGQPSLPMGSPECQRVVLRAGPHVQAPVKSLLMALVSVPLTKSSPLARGTISVGGTYALGMQTQGVL